MLTYSKRSEHDVNQELMDELRMEKAREREDRLARTI